MPNITLYIDNKTFADFYGLSDDDRVKIKKDIAQNMKEQVDSYKEEVNQDGKDNN